MAPRDFLLMMVICLAWGANNIVSKYVLSGLHVPPLFYAAARFLIVALIACRFLLPVPRPLWRLVVVVLLMGGGNFALMFLGLKLSTPSSAAIVMQLSMPLTILLSVVMLRERISPRRAVGMSMIFGGVLTVMWDPHGLALSPGLLLIALSSLSTALGAVLMKRLEGVKPMTYQAWTGFASLWPLIPLTVWLEPGQLLAAQAAGWPFIVAVLFSALVASLGAHTLFYMLVQRYDPNLISALALLGPLVTIGLGVVLLHDPFGLRMAAGAVLTLVGVLIITLRANQILLLLDFRSRRA